LNRHRQAASFKLFPTLSVILLQAELFENPPEIADGWLTLNDAPGLGLTLSEDAVAEYGERVT